MAGRAGWYVGGLSSFVLAFRLMLRWTWIRSAKDIAALQIVATKKSRDDKRGKTWHFVGFSVSCPLA